MHRIKFIFSIIMIATSGLVFGQDAAVEIELDDKGFSLTEYPLEIITVILLVSLLLVILLLLLFSIMVQLGLHYRKIIQDRDMEMPWILKLFGVFEGDNRAITGEYVAEPMDNHEYDGIQELDNDLPPWWKWGFYITIVFAVVYLLSFHVFDFQWAKLSNEEYMAEVNRAKVLYADVDINYEGPETDEAILKEVATMFNENCSLCHGEVAQGGDVGPNLTDKYWLYGGDINDVYKTVKYGTKKGMKAWKTDFNNEQIYHLSSYVLSLQGTNAPDAREPQGELYEPEKKPE